MTDLLRQRVDALEIENNELRETIRQLEEQLFNDAWFAPIEFCLTPAEASYLAALMGATRCTKDMLLMASRRTDDDVEIKIVDVFICKLRKKLKPFGIEIKTDWGRGYYLTAEMKTRVSDFTKPQNRSQVA
ncbi:MAG: helix-turn-helix domain-containing protein [Pseudomonadota bacterium]